MECCPWLAVITGGGITYWVVQDWCSEVVLLSCETIILGLRCLYSLEISFKSSLFLLPLTECTEMPWQSAWHLLAAWTTPHQTPASKLVVMAGAPCWGEGWWAPPALLCYVWRLEDSWIEPEAAGSAPRQQCCTCCPSSSRAPGCGHLSGMVIYHFAAVCGGLIAWLWWFNQRLWDLGAVTAAKSPQEMHLLELTDTSSVWERGEQIPLAWDTLSRELTIKPFDVAMLFSLPCLPLRSFWFLGVKNAVISEGGFP